MELEVTRSGFAIMVRPDHGEWELTHISTSSQNGERPWVLVFAEVDSPQLRVVGNPIDARGKRTIPPDRYDVRLALPDHLMDQLDEIAGLLLGE